MSYRRKPVPSFDFQGILPYVIPAKAGIHRIRPLPIRLCEKGFSPTKQSHKSLSINFTIIWDLWTHKHHVVLAKADTQI